ncbi:hypothetical protein AAGG74_14710 [Bacillus mexicanus]|uniref:hypothetical protein n=1 Tax=Bacillus mexicanus TaxID=2834415 RepID=UPI003D2066DD
MSTEKTILEELKNRDIPNALYKSIFPILEKNLDRVRFVKSFYGLKDIFYFEEIGLEIYDFPFFLSLNCQPTLTEEDKHKNISSIYENAITDVDEIIRKMIHFFANTNKTLFIQAAVKETKLTNDDMWKVFHHMKDYPDKEPFEIMTRMYQYPDWYTAEYGEEIALFENSFSLLKELEKKNILSLINTLKIKIDSSLEKNDMENVSVLVKELKKLEAHKQKI